jgi:hypothetical protein
MSESWREQPPQVVRQRVRLDRYAVILAHVFHYGAGRTSEVVARFGLTSEAWSVVDSVWSASLAAALRRQQSDLAMQFASEFFRARTNLANDNPPIASIGDGEPERVEPAARPSAPSPEPVQLPTYQLAERARLEEGAARMRTAAEAAPAAPGPVAPASPGPAVAPAVPTPTAAPVRAAEAAPGLRKETSDIDLRAVIDGLNLPFKDGVYTPAPAPNMARPARSGATESLDLDARPRRTPSPVLPMDSYARISARLALGEDKAKVLGAFGLDDASWLLIATGWSERLRANPSLMKDYQALVKQLNAKPDGG